MLKLLKFAEVLSRFNTEEYCENQAHSNEDFKETKTQGTIGTKYILKHNFVSYN